MVGLSGDGDTDSSVMQEDAIFQDIVIANYMDSYKNLSYKALTAMHWVKTYCSTPEHIVKMDDDIVVNPFVLARYLDLRLKKKRAKENHLNALGVINDSKESVSLFNSFGTNRSNNNHLQASEENLLTGSNINEISHSKPTLIGSIDCYGIYPWGLPVIRDNTSQWYVSEAEYLPDLYPNYCSGMAFIMDAEVPPLLLEASLESRFLWVDDVFLTGVLRDKCAIPIVSINSMYEQDMELFHQSVLSGETMFMHTPVDDIKFFSFIWNALLTKEHQV